MKRKYSLRWTGALLLWLFTAIPTMGQNLTGRITSEGSGVKGGVVSDGDALTVTDAEGRYALQSDKRNGYVFYSLPRGYEPELKDGFNPQFWSRLSSPDVNVRETHDFRLLPTGRDNYVLLLGADTHLANRAEDLRQYQNLFIPCLEREKRAAGRRRVYSMLLGDLAWDVYWTQNQYDLHDFLQTQRDVGYSVPLWPVIGNYDNDPSIPEGPDTDFLSAGAWRDVISPNYYSFNLGHVHYIVLDDIIYKNEDTGARYAKGVAGSRNYDARVTDEQLRWLKQDLAYVKDRRAPIVVALHIPTVRLGADDFRSYIRLQNGDELFSLFKDFREVHVVSGHTHYNYTAHPEAYPNITEHNIAAICATWWNTGHVSGRHVCQDGSPGGYALWTIRGRRLRWQYHSMEMDADAQFRVYDMNSVRAFYRENPEIRAILKKYPTRMDYGQLDDNLIYINVFNYDTDWKVEVREDGRRLPVERIRAEDPLHTLAYDVPQQRRAGKIGTGSATKPTLHIFRVQARKEVSTVRVRVTDRFGETYEQTIRRPYAFHL